MKKILIDSLNELKFSSNSKEALITAFNKIKGSDNSFILFEKTIDLYYKNQLKDFAEAVCDLEKVSELTEVNHCTVFLLFYVLLVSHTKELYKEKNISYEIFLDSVSDLIWKQEECYKFHGVYGTFSAQWQWQFFNLTRFKLGRLQYELINSDINYLKNGYFLKEGDIYINIHIPSSGHLLHADCIKSYKMAAEFYKDSFKGRDIAFICTSWLLFSKHRTMLTENSNIVKFMNDFDIFSEYEDENYDNMWRIFYKAYSGSTEDLPSSSSLQKGYIKLLNNGEKTGGARGIFFIDNNTRIK